MQELLQLQNANRLVISFDHAAPTGVDDGGIGTWLLAGARVFQKRLRERATPPLITKLFPKGVPLGLMGDGSNDRSMAEQEAVVLRFVGSDGKPFNSFFELAQLDLSKSEVTERDGHPTARAVKASAPLKTAARRPCVVVVVVVVVVAATPNYLRQASQNLGKYWRQQILLRTSAPIQRQASGHATAVSKRRNNLPSHFAACRSVCVWPLQRFRDRDQPRTARMHPHKPLVKSSCDGTCDASNKPIPVPLDPCVHFMSYSSVMPFHVPLGPCIHLMSYSSIAPRSSFP